MGKGIVVERGNTQQAMESLPTLQYEIDRLGHQVLRPLDVLAVGWIVQDIFDQIG